VIRVDSLLIFHSISLVTAGRIDDRRGDETHVAGGALGDEDEMRPAAWHHEVYRMGCDWWQHDDGTA
jgi:hypothetical protein